MNNILNYNNYNSSEKINESSSGGEYQIKLDHRDGFDVNFPAGDITTIEDLPIKKGILKDLEDIGFDDKPDKYYEFDNSSCTLNIEYDIEISKRSFGIDDITFSPYIARVMFIMEELDSEGDIKDYFDMEFEIDDFGDFDIEMGLPLYITNVEVDIPSKSEYKGESSVWWKDTSQWKWNFQIGSPE